MEKTGFCRFFNWRPFEMGSRRVQKEVEKVLRVLKFDGPYVSIACTQSEHLKARPAGVAVGDGETAWIRR